ncbi:hypothetical protein KJ780_00315 [Candidatus Micrarchaeota archaeon]|nr:hypothetical protein [Candidatus Micrarchaeota archaeon]
MRRVRKVTIIELTAPTDERIDEEIKWLCRCLDINPKKNRLAFEIFLHLLDASRQGKGIKTIDLTRDLNVTQAAVVYHMNSFLDSGIVIKRGREYLLRGGNLERTIDEMQADVLRRMLLLRKIAKEIDEGLFR